jgi:hypothetical protein
MRAVFATGAVGDGVGATVEVGGAVEDGLGAAVGEDGRVGGDSKVRVGLEVAAGVAGKGETVVGVSGLAGVQAGKNEAPVVRLPRAAARRRKSRRLMVDFDIERFESFVLIALAARILPGRLPGR